MSEGAYEKPPEYSVIPQGGSQRYNPFGDQPSLEYLASAPRESLLPVPSYPIASQPPAYTTPNYGSTVITITQQPTYAGTCPACRIGFVEDDYTCLGICCAIFCFPCGILCCLLLKDRRCSSCGAYFG